MANFTDSSVLPQLTSYKPYISQMPLVEEYSIVGREKQQKYDEGIQKIQGQIDTVAGMDVVRDVDKAYLQQALNQLGGNLRKVAAGDFSNYQLVNSVGGMISQIGKDTNIQNAVSGTAKYRKGVAAMETAIKEGKSSPSNEYAFTKQANEWLNDGNVKSSFNGTYKPYTNWKKNGLELLKALTKDETITDDAFTVDSKGNLVIADSTVRKKMAGISPEKIQQALLVGLTPGDFEQMSIDGMYSYANVDTPRFMKSVQEGHESTMQFYQNQRNVLQNAKMSTTSAIEKSNLDKQIDQLDKVIRNVNSEYGDIVSLAQQGNGDAAKAQYYTRNAIDGFAKAFSYTETSETFAGKTPQEMAMWREDKAQDWKKFMLNYEQEADKFKLTYSQKERELAQKDKELAGIYGGLPGSISQADVPKYTLGRVVNDIDNGIKELQASDTKFISDYNASPEWFQQQKAAWEKSPGAVPKLIDKYFTDTEKRRREIESNAIMVGDIAKEATEKFGTIDKLIPNNAPLRYTNTETGDEFIYSPKDFVDFNSELNKYRTIAVQGGTGGGAVHVTNKTEEARRDMSPKMFHLFQIMSEKKPLSKADKQLRDTLQKYNEEVNQPHKKTIEAINDYTAQEVTNRITYNQGVAYGVPVANKAQETAIANVLTQFADKAESMKGGLASSPEFDSPLARKLATESPTYSMTVVEGSEFQQPQYEVSVSGKSGTTKFNITPEEKTAVFGSMFEASPAVQAARPYQNQIRKTGGVSTNKTGSATSSWDTSFLNKIDFTGVKNYGVKGDVVKSGDSYSVILNIYDPTTGEYHENIEYPRIVGEESIALILRGLSDSAIFELINEQPATANDLKAVERASKKPL